MFRAMIFAMRKIYAVLFIVLMSVGIAGAAPRPGGGSGSGQPVIVASDVMRQQLIYVEPPAYPSTAKSAGTTGTVVLSVVVDATGKVASCAVVSGPATFTSAAVAAVNNWTYKPYVVNGSAVPVQTTVTVAFSLGK